MSSTDQVAGGPPVPWVALELPTFDLSYVVEQLAHKAEYSGWTPVRFTKAVEEYRKFLALCRAHKGQAIVPSQDVDQIWHRHILNTRRYMADCQVYFGYYLHHRPTEAFEIESGTSNAAWSVTQRLYRESFGNGLSAESGDCSDQCSGPSGCGDNCVSVAVDN